VVFDRDEERFVVVVAAMTTVSEDLDEQESDDPETEASGGA